jgi:hypothetical protein
LARTRVSRIALACNVKGCKWGCATNFMRL